jgi:hypothetical protein
VLFFEGNLIPTGDNIVKFLCILNGEFVASWVPRGGKDQFLKLRIVLFKPLRLTLCIRVKDVII